MGCLAAAVALSRPAQLKLVRLFGALRLAEWLLLTDRPFPRRPWFPCARLWRNEHQQSGRGDAEPERHIRAFWQCSPLIESLLRKKQRAAVGFVLLARPGC
jgi:hypothetical protein